MPDTECHISVTESRCAWAAAILERGNLTVNEVVGRRVCRKIGAVKLNSCWASREGSHGFKGYDDTQDIGRREEMSEGENVSRGREDSKATRLHRITAEEKKRASFRHHKKGGNVMN